MGGKEFKKLKQELKKQKKQPSVEGREEEEEDEQDRKQPVKPLPAKTKAIQKIAIEDMLSGSFVPVSDKIPAPTLASAQLNASADEKDNVKITASNMSQYLSMTPTTAVREDAQSTRSGFFSKDMFEDLEICSQTKEALKKMEFTNMTQIQSKTITHLLKGRDVLGAAKTGSGKTLAFLVPGIEMLFKANFTQKMGTGIIIITPTRELATQIFDVAKEILFHHDLTLGLLIGGANRRAEAGHLRKGVNMIVATPGRLLDHLQNTAGFIFSGLLGLFIDEADALLRIGFQDEMNEIIKLLPISRQTVLFSATQSKKIEDLARLSLRQPIYIGVDDQKIESTVEGLDQGYVIIDADKKLRLLYTFLHKRKTKKIMVFFSTCNSVKFHSDLFNYVDFQVLDIHGNQKQPKRLSTFYEFTQTESGILFCTDVAARGLDIPNVDWIVQFDPADDTKEYIHRVGRTCRGANSNGKALLFLLPQEEEYLKNLKQVKVNLNEYEFPDNKLANIQDQIEKLVYRNRFLNKAAHDAFRSYLHSYQAHTQKDIFNIKNLDMKLVAKAFGFSELPNVTLSGNPQFATMKISSDKAEKKQTGERVGQQTSKSLDKQDYQPVAKLGIKSINKYEINKSQAQKSTFKQIKHN